MKYYLINSLIKMIGIKRIKFSSVFGGLLFLCFVSIAVTTQAQSSGNSESDKLALIVEDYQKFKASEYETIWPIATEEKAQQKSESLILLQQRLSKINRKSLKGQDVLSYEVLNWVLSYKIEELTFDQDRVPFISGDGFYNQPISRASWTTIRNAKEAESWIKGLEQLPAFYENNIQNMQRGIEEQFVQSKIIAQRTLESLEEIYSVPVSEDPLLVVFDKNPGLADDATLLEYRAKAEEIVKTLIRPAQKKVIIFFKDEYIPNARSGFGVCSMPGGKEYYEYLVRFHTSLDMTPDEVFAIGESEVARIRSEMEAVIEETGFEGTFSDFLKFVTTDTKFHAANIQDALEKASEIAKRVEYLLPQYFEKLPRLTYGVWLQPEWYKGSGASNPGNPDTGQAGYIAMGRSSDKAPIFNLPPWILHEGVPGHQLQMSMMMENKELPEFRRSDGITAYVEGWALYSEKLGIEMGMYTTPYENFGRLTLEMWRACRLVVDVGIHYKGWTFEQACNYMKDYTALVERDIEKEVLRYGASPGQALGYKIGEIEILKFRKRAEDALGENFNLRKFNTMLTDNGIMPMQTLSALTDRWIVEQQKMISEKAATNSVEQSVSGALASIIEDFQKFNTPRYETIWPVTTTETNQQKINTLSLLEERLNKIDLADLQGEDIITYQVLKWRISHIAEGLAFFPERIPFDYSSGFFITPNTVAERTSITNTKEAESWIKRLEQIPDYFANNVQNMRLGIDENFVQSKLMSERALEKLEEMVAVPIEEDPMVLVFDKNPQLATSTSLLEYRNKTVKLVKKVVRPAQRRLIKFFKKEYIPNTREWLGVGSMPNGKEYYEYCVRFHTSTNITPDEVFALGESEVARIHSDMEEIIKETGFEGSFEEFLNFGKTDPQFRADDLQDALEKACEIAKRVDYLLPQYFEKLPRLTYGVRFQPKWYKGSGASHLGDPKAGIAGYVGMNYHADKTPLFNLPAWVLHEGRPGHQLQITLMQERYDLPEVRRSGTMNGYLEGWALYSEKLGVEMGMYRTPYENFGRLTNEMWRACRLVVDVGIHYKGWTFEQAVNYMKSYTALIDQDIEKEVARYATWPGQAVSYKIGEIEILNLRKRAEEALGDNFDLRKFHTMLTDNGIMPLKTLSELTDRWILDQKQSIKE